jgi:hypothetical protein
MYTHSFIHTYIHTYSTACMSQRIHTYTHLYTCMNTHTHTCIHACRFTYSRQNHIVYAVSQKKPKRWHLNGLHFLPFRMRVCGLMTKTGFHGMYVYLCAFVCSTHIRQIQCVRGEPKEKEEMASKWFTLSTIPYESM